VIFLCQYFLKLEKRRKRLKLKLEMAKFLQDTIEETALQRKDASGESVHDFVKFIEKVFHFHLVF
jgi:LETM1 and EF-hand domain-containing protein 1